MIGPVYISTTGAEASEEVLVYCILDTQCDTSFITEATARKLDDHIATLYHDIHKSD